LEILQRLEPENGFGLSLNDKERAMKEANILKRVGFFRELRHGEPDGPSLRVLQREHSGAYERELVGYLTQGIPFIVSPGPVWDVFDQGGPIGTGSILTDGAWAWPDDLSYYLQMYHVVLPDEFVNYAMMNTWRVPKITRAQLRLLSLG
jgi:hypothetical protein